MSYNFNNTEFFISVDAPNKLCAAQAEVAFVGRSNVGKSSLLNMLCGRKGLAKVSKKPGKTRLINVFAIHHGKWIVDLPGYGFAAVPQKEKDDWQHMIEYYIAGRESLRAVFVLVDASVGVSKLDKQMISWLNSIEVPYRVVANKVDRISVSKLEEQRQALAKDLEAVPEYIIWTSAKKGTGIPQLQAIVSEFLDKK